MIYCITFIKIYQVFQFLENADQTNVDMQIDGLCGNFLFQLFVYFKHCLHFFEPQTDLRAKFLLEIFVYLKSPSREKKKQWRVPSSKTIAFSFTRPTAIRSLCTSNRLRLRTKKTMAFSFTYNNGAFLHQAQHDPEEFFRLGRFAVRRKVDFCKIEVPIFF